MAKHAARSRWLAWGLALVGACSDTKTQPVGEIVLFLDTDMEVPKDLTAVRVQLSTPTAVRYDMLHELGPNGFRLPATLGILAGVEDQPVTIRITAFHDHDAITFREMVTTVPRDRQVVLPVHIQWLCYGTATVTPAGIASTCPAGQSCVAGGCQSNLVDSSTLPAFDSTSVYGGGTSPATGTCFDTVGCFASGHAATVEAPCSIEAPRLGSEDKGINVALVRPLGTEGICGREACLVPLNAESDFGWKTSGGLIALPPAACDRLSDGSILGVAMTTACASKTDVVPTCGPWSTVTAVPATTDGGTAARGGAGGAAGAMGGTPGRAGECPNAPVPTATGSLTVGADNYVSVGPLHGWGFVCQGGSPSACIAPTCMPTRLCSDTAAAGCSIWGIATAICAAGTLPADPANAFQSYGNIGFLLNQDSATTGSITIANSVTVTVYLSGSGSGNAALEACLADPSDIVYCVRAGNWTSGIPIPITSFNTAWWNNTGIYASPTTPFNAIYLNVTYSTTHDNPFSFCLTNVTVQ